MSFLENLGINPEELNPETEQTEHMYEADPRSMEEIFTDGLPQTLYMNHYDFHDDYPQFTAAEWRRFLKDKDRFIILEVAAITEANARKALERLANGDLRQGDAAAITQLLNRSEQINRNLKDQTIYMTSYMPDPHSTFTQSLSTKELVSKNKRTALIFYPEEVLRQRVAKGEIAIGADNILHFPKLNALTQLDRIYMQLFNPKNKLLSTLEEGEEEWQ